MRKTIWIIFFIGGVLFLSFFTYLDIIADKKFYCKAINGVVEQDRENEKGFRSIKIVGGEWYHLGKYYSYNRYRICIGDSVVKNRGSFLITVYKDGTKMIDYTYSDKNYNCSN